MSYHTTDAFGVTHPHPPVARMRAILESVADSEDADFPDVSLIHDNGHVLTYTLDGHIIWETPEGLRRMQLNCPLPHALNLWQHLAKAELDSLEADNWDSEEEL